MCLGRGGIRVPLPSTGGAFWARRSPGVGAGKWMDQWNKGNSAFANYRTDWQDGI